MWPFKKKEIPSKIFPAAMVDYIGWRTSMWVMTPDGIGIIFKLGTECEIHLTDRDGFTMASKMYPILSLRQALFSEIPQARRHFSKETAYSLGYK